MKPFRALPLIAAAFACVASAQSPENRAKAAAGGANARYGSPDSFNENAMEPMSSGEQMSTVDGSQQFGAQMSCPGTQRFMELTVFPSGHKDIDRLAVSLDGDFNGSADFNTMLVGPFAAVCANGLVKCNAGTTTNCSHWRWKWAPGGIALDRNNASGIPNKQADLGACYCVNQSCGSNLLQQNSQKVLNDIGTGIAKALQENQPRLTVARTEQVDPMTQAFYGSQSGCSADSRPEQYYRNPGAMGGAGETIANDPNSIFYKLVNSDVAKDHRYGAADCKVERNFTLQSIDRTDVFVVESLSDGHGTLGSCGPRCYTLIVGPTGNNYWGSGGWACYHHTDETKLRINYPELIESVVMTHVSYDDWFLVMVNGAEIYNDWYGGGGWCGEHHRGTETVNKDVTSAFRAMPPGELLTISNTTAVRGRGDGHTVWQIRVKQDCQIQSESIGNACTSKESNPDCRLYSEKVDGVETVREYFSTGLQPLPSTRTLTYNGCEFEVTRDFFQKDRRYTCRTDEPPYDGEDARRRYDSIHSTYNPSTGRFTDQRKQSNGSWASSSERMSTVPVQSVPNCRLMCKTKKPRSGASMGQGGATTQQNNTGVAWDYTYKECPDASTCPVGSGETVVSGCNCDSNFDEAAALMQNIRMVGQDMVCTQKGN